MVNIGGNATTPATVVWGTSVGQQLAGTLRLGSITSTSSVTFVNPLDLNGGARTIQVDGNAGSTGRLRGAARGDQRLDRRRLVD